MSFEMLGTRVKCLGLLCLGLLVGQAQALSGTLEFPDTTEGTGPIKQLVEEHHASPKTTYQSIHVAENAYLFLVSCDKGTALSSIYTYVYGCDAWYCQLLAMRHSGKERVVGKLDEKKSELVLTSEDGEVVFLRMPLLLEKN